MFTQFATTGLDELIVNENIVTLVLMRTDLHGSPSTKYTSFGFRTQQEPLLLRMTYHFGKLVVENLKPDGDWIFYIQGPTEIGGCIWLDNIKIATMSEHHDLMEIYLSPDQIGTLGIGAFKPKFKVSRHDLLAIYDDKDKLSTGNIVWIEHGILYVDRMEEVTVGYSGAPVLDCWSGDVVGHVIGREKEGNKFLLVAAVLDVKVFENVFYYKKKSKKYRIKKGMKLNPEQAELYERLKDTIYMNFGIDPQKVDIWEIRLHHGEYVIEGFNEGNPNALYIAPLSAEDASQFLTAREKDEMETDDREEMEEELEARRLQMKLLETEQQDREEMREREELEEMMENNDEGEEPLDKFLENWDKPGLSLQQQLANSNRMTKLLSNPTIKGRIKARDYYSGKEPFGEFSGSDSTPHSLVEPVFITTFTPSQAAVNPPKAPSPTTVADNVDVSILEDLNSLHPLVASGKWNPARKFEITEEQIKAKNVVENFLSVYRVTNSEKIKQLKELRELVKKMTENLRLLEEGEMSAYVTAERKLKKFEDMEKQHTSEFSKFEETQRHVREELAKGAEAELPVLNPNDRYKYPNSAEIQYVLLKKYLVELRKDNSVKAQRNAAARRAAKARIAKEKSVNALNNTKDLVELAKKLQSTTTLNFPAPIGGNFPSSPLKAGSELHQDAEKLASTSLPMKSPLPMGFTSVDKANLQEEVNRAREEWEKLFKT